MGAAEAFQSGGWPLVTILLAAAVIAYLARKIDRLEQRDEERGRATTDLITKREERDQERLRRYEEQEQRMKDQRR